MSEEPGGPDSLLRGATESRPKQAGARRPAAASAGSTFGAADESPWGSACGWGSNWSAALVVAVAIGYGLDCLFGTKPILTAVFVRWGRGGCVQCVARCSRQTDSGDRGGSGQRGGRRIEQHRRTGPVPTAPGAGRHRRVGEFHPVQPDDGGRRRC